jgi:hypothetical protein
MKEQRDQMRQATTAKVRLDLAKSGHFTVPVHQPLASIALCSVKPGDMLLLSVPAANAIPRCTPTPTR